MARVFSGMQPSGDATLGSLLGALRNWVTSQNADAYYCVVDLHALTFPQDPAVLRRRSLELATIFLSVGLEPDVCTIFVQSHVHEHTQLAWLMECTASFGELSRMTQFKDKSEQREFVSAGLFTYPALMAADILLYDTEEVPVGDDQRQHVELTRDVAERFNSRYGPTFTVPKAVIPTAGARVMDLQDPTRKMSKSEDSPQGTIQVLEDLSSVTKKIKRAVTSTEYDPASPGAANLFSILGAVTGESTDEIAGRYSQYGPLKNDVADAVAGLLGPIQQCYEELSADPSTVAKILERGAEKAQSVASVTLARARTNIGLLDR
ncbi:MAG TPA: tryptophan--tRNA ligase [Acidimicrobiales bacterium]|nr:tryptophan--tRNA ligase [Acidimicrobiales bacterium]